MPAKNTAFWSSIKLNNPCIIFPGSQSHSLAWRHQGRVTQIFVTTLITFRPQFKRPELCAGSRVTEVATRGFTNWCSWNHLTPMGWWPPFLFVLSFLLICSLFKIVYVGFFWRFSPPPGPPPKKNPQKTNNQNQPQQSELEMIKKVSSAFMSLDQDWACLSAVLSTQASSVLWARDLPLQTCSCPLASSILRALIS